MQKTIIYILFCLPLNIFSQIGGLNTFSFSDIILSPRAVALGGSAISIVDDDVSLADFSPSILNPEMDNRLAFLFSDYFSDINILGFSYAKHLKKSGMFLISLKAINYGDFIYNDQEGNNLGLFSANDQVLNLGFARLLNKRFRLGINLSILNSQYETYNSFAIASDISLTYSNIERRLSSTLLFNNIGRQLNPYAQNEESLPFDVQIGMSKELKHLPFRYLILWHHINRFNIKSPYKLVLKTNINTGEIEVKEETISKTALRHLIIGGEFNFFRKRFFLRGGFNFQRRFDMNLVEYPSLVGFSWGTGLNVLKFRLDYSRVPYHISGPTDYFSITTNLSSFAF